MFGLGMQELMVIGVVAVLLFGRKLPEVARSLGHSYREFRRGISDIQTAVDVNEPYHPPESSSSGSSSSGSSYYDEIDDHDEATAPKFEPPPAEPKPEPTTSKE